MTRKCLAIGVSTVEPIDGEADLFPYLDGAIIAAQTMGNWAIKAGFLPADVRVLVDEKDVTVTDQDVINALSELLPGGKVTEHLIISFAGHGVTGINDDFTYWLLNDSLKNGYQIFVEDMRRELYGYGIQHLSIFSDACRAIANVPALRNLRPRPGVSRRNGPTSDDVQVDRFNACQDTTSAFMVKESGSAAPGKCIFSGVVADALWGREKLAFNGASVDSGSLGRFVRKSAQERAATYNLVLKAGGSLSFDPVIYLSQDNLPIAPNPDPHPWPPSAQLPGAAAAAPAGAGTSTAFEQVLTDTVSRKKILGESFAKSLPAIDLNTSFPGLPASARLVVEDLAATREFVATRQLDPETLASLQNVIDQKVGHLEGLATKEEAKNREASTIRSNFELVVSGQVAEESNLFVAGGGIKQLWSDDTLTPTLGGAKHQAFRMPNPLDGGHGNAGTQAVLEFGDGVFAPVWIYPQLCAVVIRDEEGVTGIAYFRPSKIDKYYEYSYRKTIDAIAAMASGSLSVEEVTAIATSLRHDKHLNPAFGSLAAYCYDVVGDLGNIRRMAYFYVMNGQAIPYDIVLMGMIHSHGGTAYVPAVAKRKSSDLELPIWATESTPATEGSIAGRCPWLRQGWDYLAVPVDVERPLVGDLVSFRAGLKHSNFTSLDRDHGMALVQQWRLKGVATEKGQ